MSDVRCPHCGSRPEGVISPDNISDWYYNQNLYCPDEELEIKCPACDDKFWVKTYSMVGYECAKKREDL